MKTPNIRTVEVGPLFYLLSKKEQELEDLENYQPIHIVKKRERERNFVVKRILRLHEQPFDKVIMDAISGLNQFISAEARNIDVIVPDYT